MCGSLHWSVSLPQHVAAGTCLYAWESPLVSESSSTCCSWDMSVCVGVSTAWSVSLLQHVLPGTGLYAGKSPLVSGSFSGRSPMANDSSSTCCS